MHSGRPTDVDDAVGVISVLLAKAYKRHVDARAAGQETETLLSTGALDNAGNQSLHELRLTGRGGH